MNTARISAIREARLMMGGLLIVTGIFALMFHVVLFPIIGIVMGVVWAGAGLGYIARPAVSQNNREPAVCSPRLTWQNASCR